MSGSILIDARLPWGSGIGRYVSNIVPRVAARLDAHSFTLLVSVADADRAAAAVAACPNVTVTGTALRPFSLAEQVRLPALARSHALTWFTNYWVPLGWRGPFVATVHDLIHLDPRFPAARAKRYLAARTFAKVCRDAAHLVFVSRFTARTFEAVVGVPRASSVVHHGIDHAGAAVSLDVVRERIALVVAAAKEHKNLTLVLDAWRGAALPDWTLVVVTPDDRLRSSIDLEAEVESTANIRILRGIDDAELTSLYARAGFVLVPSRYEGFGLPLLEAMRAGAPVVSSTAEALVEVASGALLPFVAAADRDGWVGAIRTIAAHCGPSDAWQAEVSARNHTVAEAFTWTRAADHTAAILSEALTVPQ